MSFSGWSFLGQVAIVFSSQGNNILLNMFYGVVVNAALGISNQVNSALMSFVSNFQTAFKPQITKSYANNDLVDVDETNNVNDLKNKLKSSDRQVLVTTIQKLQRLITKRLQEDTSDYNKLKFKNCFCSG